MSSQETPPVQSVIVDDAAGDELSLRQLLVIAWRGRWILLICTAIGLGLGVRKVQEQGDIWRAESRLSVQGEAPSVMGIDGLISSGARNFANTQAAVLRSVSLLQSVVVRPEIAASPIFGEETNKVGWLREELNVGVGRDDDVISVSLESADVAQACVVVNAIVEEYRVHVGQRGENTVRDTLDVLKTQKENLQAERDQYEEAKEQFLEKNSQFALDPNGAGRVFEQEQLNNYRRGVDEAERQYHEAKTRVEELRLIQNDYELLAAFAGDLNRISYQRAEPTDPKFLALLSDIDQSKDEVERLRAQKVSLMTSLKLTAEHPAVEELDERIGLESERLTTLQGELDAFESDEDTSTTTEEAGRVASMLAVYEKRAEDAATWLSEAKSRLEDQRTVAATAGDLQAEYDRLDLDVARALTAIDEVSANIRSLNLAELGSENLTAMSVDVLDPATLDTAELASSKARTLAVFLILGLLAGSGLTWVRTMLDQRLRSEEDLARTIPSPLLGVLPRTRFNAAKSDAIREWSEHRALAESARGLRTAVYFSLPQEDGRILHLTSPEKGDGKSTASAYLAIAMAQAGQTVLLIDADLRSPSQNKIFGLSNEVGLSDALIDPDTPLSGMIQKTELAGLEVLTTGPIPSAPAEMLNSRRFQDLLGVVADVYDRVIVDSPPVLAVTDSRVIATKCDATILVTRVDKSKRSSAAAAYDRIASVGARVLGVVLNAMPTGFGYGYGAGYGYGYGYGSNYGDPIPESRPRRVERSGSAAESNGGPFVESRFDAGLLEDAPEKSSPSSSRKPSRSSHKDRNAAKESRAKSTPPNGGGPNADADPFAEPTDHSGGDAKNSPTRVTPSRSKRKRKGGRRTN